MSTDGTDIDFEDQDRDRTLDELEDTDVAASDLAAIDAETDLDVADEDFGGLDSNVDDDDEELTEAGFDEEADEVEDYLDDSSESDDLPVTPAESRPINAEIGLDADDDGVEETIDQRIVQEEPEAGSAYGKPEDGVDLRRERHHPEARERSDRTEAAEDSAMHVGE